MNHHYILSMRWAIVFALVGGVVILSSCGGNEKESEPAQQMISQQAMPQDTVTTRNLEPEDPPELQQPVRVATTAEGNYTVQVSSWRTRSKAEKDASRFQAEGLEAYVLPAEIPSKGGTWYRVRVGRFATLADARQEANDLIELLESGYWVDRARGGQ